MSRDILGIEGESTPEEEYEFDLPGGYLSASRINKYLTCPESFRRTYVEGKRFVPKARMAQGSTVHRLVELTLLEVMETGSLPAIEEVLDQSGGAFAACFSEVEDLEETSATEWEALSQDLYKIWYKTVAPGIKPLGVEERIEANIAGAKVIGFIDLIDGANNRKTVVDLKVVGRAKREADAKNSVQLGVYSIATGIRNVGFDSLVKTAIPSVKIVRTSFSEGEILWMEEIVRSTAEAICAGIFPKASPDTWVCSAKWCDHWDDCRGSQAFVPVSSLK